MLSKKQLPYLFLLLFLVSISCKKEIHMPDQTKKMKQELSQTCGTEAYLGQQLKDDPQMEGRINAIKTNNFHLNRTSSGTAIIPVVVHIVYNTPEENLSDAQIQSQIDVLNEDYSRQNADAANTPAHFQSLAANTQIQFVLAKQDPNGNASNGITRTFTNTVSFTTNGYVKYDSYGGKNAWNTSQYLNIWVCDLAGYAGYSSVPGSSAATDGVVIDYLSFGRIGTLMSSTRKGRTTVHEVGHWFGLAHLWGPSGTCGDDGVADTPTQEKANSGFPVYPHVSSCSPDAFGDMFMSYMDYTDDGAMNMFSIGQSDKMNDCLYGYRSSLLTSPGAMDPGTIPTTCNVPSGLIANSISSTSVTLNWTPTGAISYNVRYKPVSSSSWITTSSTSNTFNLPGLTPSTNYEFQVASVCSSTLSSAFSGSANFTISASASCNVPGGLYASAITGYSAILNWTSTGADTYTVRYKLVNSGIWTTFTTASLSITINGLSAFKKYEFQVSGNCSGISSAYSASKVFTTTKNGKNL